MAIVLFILLGHAPEWFVITAALALSEFAAVSLAENAFPPAALALQNCYAATAIAG